MTMILLYALSGGLPEGEQPVADVEALVARMPGAVFAVDSELHVVALNKGAQRGLRVSAEAAQGKPCYEVVPAIDLESGRPCYEQCPLVHGSTRYGWAYNRVLRAPWVGDKRARLDCFLFKCLLSGTKRGTLCFVGPLSGADVEAHSRVLEAIEAIYPAIARSGDPAEAVRTVLGAVLQGTAADEAFLYALDPERGEFQLLERVGRIPETSIELVGAALGDDLPTVLGRSETPILLGPLSAARDQPWWFLCVPLQAEERVIGALAIAACRTEFNVGLAARVLFPVAVQLSVFLRWAYLVSSGDVSKRKEESPQLRFYCFGRLRTVLDGVDIPSERFQRLKALTVLRYLVAHRGRPVARDALVELLWPEADPIRASNNLRVVLHDLRRVLQHPASGEPLLRTQGELVYLGPPERIWVDTEEFLARTRRAAELQAAGSIGEALAECRRAAGLYAGDYLEDEPYSDWCLAEREHLQEVYLGLLRRMAALLIAQDRCEEAVDTYRAVVRVDPVREESHQDLIRLLAQVGRKDEALRQYDVCRAILLQEIGVEPSAGTKTLYEKVQTGAVSTVGPAL